SQVPTVDVDRFIGPFSRQSELSPGADVTFRPAGELRMPVQPDPAAAALGPENAVELLDCQLRERAVFVHEDGQSRSPARDVKGAGRHLDLQREIAEGALECQQLIEGDGPTRAQVS